MYVTSRRQQDNRLILWLLLIYTREKIVCCYDSKYLRRSKELDRRRDRDECSKYDFRSSDHHATSAPEIVPRLLGNCFSVFAIGRSALG